MINETDETAGSRAVFPLGWASWMVLGVGKVVLEQHRAGLMSDRLFWIHLY